MQLLTPLALAFAPPAQSAPAPLPPPPLVEHDYPPGSVATYITYTCKNHTGSIALQKGQFVKLRVAALYRNEWPAGPAVIDRVNAAIADFDSVRSIQPMCHKHGELLLVEGLKGGEGKMIYIPWSAVEAKPGR